MPRRSFASFFCSAFVALFLPALFGCTPAQSPPSQNPQEPSQPVVSAARLMNTGPSPKEMTIISQVVSTSTLPSRTNLILQRPVEGGTVTTNPIAIQGLARTFENHLTLRLLDSQGHVLGRTAVIATGDAGKMNPFRATFYLTSPPLTAFLAIEAIDYSAKDGSVAERATVHFRYDNRLIPITLYLPRLRSAKDDCGHVEKIIRRIPATTSLARTVIEALLAGPSTEEGKRGFSSPFPKGVNLRSVNLAAGILTADFDGRLGNVGGSCRARGARAALEQSLLALPSVKRVRILSMGNEQAALQP